VLHSLDIWHYMYYHIDMKESRRIPNVSVRIDTEVLHLAKIEAVKAKVTLGQWLSIAIKEKIERER
jgi:hypothetical protein